LPDILKPQNRVIPLKDIISDIPKIRSRLSKQNDSSIEWVRYLKSLSESKWLKNMNGSEKQRLTKNKLLKTLSNIKMI